MHAAQSRPHSLTQSVEDYLKAIYRLSLDGRSVSTSEIAETLALAPPSVSGMVKRLSEQGLLEHVPYRGVVLTPAGRRAALAMVRRHRLIETYLVERLGYAWDEVHDEAERLEHAVSDRMVERMAQALGHPQFDPHGDPIPDLQGRMEELVYTPLADIPVGETAEVRRVATAEGERLRYIAGMGLVPGVPVRILDRQPFNGPMAIRVMGETEEDRVIGHEIGSLVLCTRPHPISRRT